MSNIIGIVNSDLVLMQAIRDGLEQLRQYPVLFEFIFKQLFDENFEKRYGNKELVKIKNWFNNTQIPVVQGFIRLDKPALPQITVRMLSSTESKPHATLSDGDGQNIQDFLEENEYFSEPRSMLGPFTPIYDSITGIMTLPSGLSTDEVFPGQSIYAPSSGKEYKILNVTATNTITIGTGIQDTFENAIVRPAFNNIKIKYNKITLAQNYEIGIYTSIDTGQLTYLSFIIQYLLLKYRRDFLEAENINISNFGAGPLEQGLFEDTNVQFIRQNINLDFLSEARVVQDFSPILEGISALNISITTPVESTSLFTSDVNVSLTISGTGNSGVNVTGTVPAPDFVEGKVLTEHADGTITWEFVKVASGDVPSTRTLTAGAGLTGGGDLSANRVFNVGANSDGSITVNADDIQVGVLANDAQHGNRGGGSIHSIATPSAAGFESAADKSKLDGIAAGAAALGSATPQPVGASAVGSSVNASHEDHVHAHGNQAGGTLHPNATTALAGFAPVLANQLYASLSENPAGTPAWKMPLFTVWTNTTTRDAGIPAGQRVANMWARTGADGAVQLWQLKADLTTWVDITPIVAGSYMAETTDNVTLVVSSTGNDSDPNRPSRCSGGDYSANPFATIAAARASLPKTLKHFVIIQGLAGSFAGDTFGGFFGGSDGALCFQGSWSLSAVTTGTASGTATGGSATTLTDSTQSWTVNDLRGKFIILPTGNGSASNSPSWQKAFVVGTILSNTATTITLIGSFQKRPASLTPAPIGTCGAGTTYQIVDPATIITSVLFVLRQHCYTQFSGLNVGGSPGIEYFFSADPEDISFNKFTGTSNDILVYNCANGSNVTNNVFAGGGPCNHWWVNGSVNVSGNISLSTSNGIFSHLGLNGQVAFSTNQWFGITTAANFVQFDSCGAGSLVVSDNVFTTCSATLVHSLIEFTASNCAGFQRNLGTNGGANGYGVSFSDLLSAHWGTGNTITGPVADILLAGRPVAASEVTSLLSGGMVRIDNTSVVNG